MVFQIYFSFTLIGEAIKEGGVPVGTAKILLSKIYWPKGPKIFGDRKICAGDKSKVEPCYI